MAYRNGIVADTLRSAGMDCYRIIFGLNMPQLTQIAKQYGKDKALAQTLWSDTGVRESRLLAAYLFPADDITLQEAEALMNSVQTQEEADILAFRLLRYLPFLDLLKATATRFCSKALSRY